MAENKKKKSNFSIRRLIYNDKYLIIISLILAVIVWMIASINIGTDETKTIKMNVPIALADEISDHYGMQYYSLQDSVELSVTVSGPKYVIGQVTENDLSVKFDSSSVTRTGSQTIPILVSNNSKSLDFDVKSTYPSSIEAYFDVNSTKTFDVDVLYDENNIESGYIFGKPILSEDKVVVSGPQTYVDKIESVYVDVKFEGDNKLTEPYNAEGKLNFKGIGAESNYLKINSKLDEDAEVSNVSVTIPVLKKTTLPVTVNIEGEPFDVLGNIDISYSEKEINAGVLDSAKITKAVIGTIDYKELRAGTNTFTFDVSNLQGITVLDDLSSIDVVVKVGSPYTESYVDIGVENVELEGLAEGKTATVTSINSQNALVIAPKDVKIDSSNIILKCDVSKKKKDNVYVAEVIINSNNNSWVYGNYEVTIEIK